MRSRTSVLRLGLLALLWGSSFLWIELALRAFSPVQIVFVRLALGATVLVSIALAAGLRFPRGWRTWAHLAVAAMFANAAPYLLFGIGQQSVASNIAGMLNATTPLWAVTLAFATRADPYLTWRLAAGVTTGMAGVLLIFSPWQTVGQMATWGGLACLAAAACYGLSYVYMGRFLTGRGVPPLILSASQLTAATILLAAAMPVAGTSPVTWRLDASVSLLILGGACTGAAYVLLYRLITDEGATAASTVTYLLPVVAVALGWLVLREPVTTTMAIGTVLVLAGVALAQRTRTGDHPKPRSTTRP